MYYIIYNGQQVGPMDARQLIYYGLNEQSDVRVEGSDMWVKAYTIPALMEIMPHYGATPPPIDNLAYTGVSGKSRLVAGLFAILLGGIGLQYFYLGKVSGGFICILLTFVTCGLWSIISIVQGIMMIVMPQEDFERKYVFTQSSFPVF